MVNRLLFGIGASAGALLFAPMTSCGGQSLADAESDDSERGGSGGSVSGGASGRGGSAPTGGAAPSGGTSSGGNGGTTLGGTSSGGGAAVGGTSFGGSTSTGGAAGAAGATSVCDLPRDPGPCRGYVPSFGYSVSNGNCQPFVYGGCEGNANRFETLAACELECGGSLSSCPATYPDGEACMGPATCTYGFDLCLCAPAPASLSCTKIDETCGSDAGVSGIRIGATHYACSCDAGLWSCRVETLGFD